MSQAAAAHDGRSIITVATEIRAAALLALSAALVVIAGCSSGTGAEVVDSSADPNTTATEAAAEAPIDACALVAPEKITSLLGTAVEGVSTSMESGPYGCMWENPANSESVSVDIGNPGTASDNTLPTPEPGIPDVTTPGPDGMRFVGYGAVDFAAGGRLNTVQVAVLNLGQDEANSAAVQLAREIGPKLPS